MKKQFSLLKVLLWAIVLSGCSRSLDDSIIETAIKNALKDSVPDEVVGNYLGGTNAQIDEFEILDKSYEKEEPNSFEKAFGAEPKNYWLVDVRVKGQAQLGGNSMMAGLLSGDPHSKKTFDSRIKYRLYQRQDGSWIAKY